MLFLQGVHFRVKLERHTTPLQPLRRASVQMGKAFPGPEPLNLALLKPSSHLLGRRRTRYNHSLLARRHAR
jgi:hypothetical protein